MSRKHFIIAYWCDGERERERGHVRVCVATINECMHECISGITGSRHATNIRIRVVCVRECALIMLKQHQPASHPVCCNAFHVVAVVKRWQCVRVCVWEVVAWLVCLLVWMACCEHVLGCVCVYFSLCLWRCNVSFMATWTHRYGYTATYSRPKSKQHTAFYFQRGNGVSTKPNHNQFELKR